MNEFQSIATVLCSETGIGISAKTIISAFANLDYYYHDIPRDNDDLKRCLYLLSFFPHWEKNIHLVAKKYPEWSALCEHWQEIKLAYTSGHLHLSGELLRKYS